MANKPHPHSIIAIIPARGGSKSIPGKNIKDFHGKPLIQWTIETALACNRIDRVILSTDDPEISKIGKNLGVDVPFLRPEYLSTDTATSPQAVKHALEWISDKEGTHFDYVVLLEPTAPARTSAMIESALQQLIREKADSISGVSQIPHHNCSEKALNLDSQGRLQGAAGIPIPDMKHRRQTISPTFGFNGLIWACRCEFALANPPSLWGKLNLGFEIEEKYAIDLDTQWDWDLGEAQMEILIKKKLI